MKIKILKPTMIGGTAYLTGDVVDADENDAVLLISMRKAATHKENGKIAIENVKNDKL